jgi:hypothetical protein
MITDGNPIERELGVGSKGDPYPMLSLRLVTSHARDDRNAIRPSNGL